MKESEKASTAEPSETGHGEGELRAYVAQTIKPYGGNFVRRGLSKAGAVRGRQGRTPTARELWMAIVASSMEAGTKRAKNPA